MFVLLYLPSSVGGGREGVFPPEAVFPPFEGPLDAASSVALLEPTIYRSGVVFAKVDCCSLERFKGGRTFFETGPARCPPQVRFQ